MENYHTIQIDRRREFIVSLNVDVCNAASIAESVEQLVSAGNGGYVCFSTVHMVMESYDDPEYAAKVNAADMVIPDGMPLVWMQKLSGRKNAARTRANDMMIGLCELAERNGWPVGFYGSDQPVIDRMLERVEKDFPRLNVSYAFSPPFRPLTPEESNEIVEQIQAAGPKLLFVGLGCPKQENWMSKNTSELNAVMFGVGASFDFFAGNVKESPQWLGGLGLEWLYRLWQEPRRLWQRYLVLNPRFIFQAIRQLIGRKKKR